MPEDKYEVDYIQKRPQHDPNTRAILMGVGVFLFLAATGFLILVAGFGVMSTDTVEVLPSQTAIVEPIEQEQDAVSEKIIIETPTSLFVTNTPLATVDLNLEEEQANTDPIEPTQEIIQPTQEIVQPTEEEVVVQPTVESPPVTAPIIEWTQEEKNALTWLCHGEVGGMGTVTRVDACLSVISTVRQRYAYPNGFVETDVMGTLLRPNQFNVEIRTEEPHPNFVTVVDSYETGARGSCNGFLFFDSVPGGPSLCRIDGLGGQFIEFHNGWN